MTSTPSFAHPAPLAAPPVTVDASRPHPTTDLQPGCQAQAPGAATPTPPLTPSVPTPPAQAATPTITARPSPRTHNTLSGRPCNGVICTRDTSTPTSSTLVEGEVWLGGGLQDKEARKGDEREQAPAFVETVTEPKEGPGLEPPVSPRSLRERFDKDSPPRCLQRASSSSDPSALVRGIISDGAPAADVSSFCDTHLGGEDFDIVPVINSFRTLETLKGR
ncbi:hypothetical protein EDB85DRAFT_2231938 [Lactarius pseudohatsudake]|nr:hypothetical protein EDB85DRAFT_2163916 [Lactarius pseudohatsudake]KAH9032772.1 hypothetical protein EDB85DRAFT_2231938 [Lactarius pseudohatsudake]